jgi:hypothetical protein
LNELKKDIRKAVDKIVIKKRGTPEGDAQREAFRIRWGKMPQDL